MADPEKQPTEEIDPREVTLGSLREARLEWKQAPDGVTRMDAYRRIDKLLDNLGSLGTGEVVEFPGPKEDPPPIVA